MLNYKLFSAVVLLMVSINAATASEPASCIIEQNFYYPKAGMEKQALAVRIKGSEIRQKLGLPAGRLLVVTKATSGHPTSGKIKPLDMSYITSLTEFANEEEALAASKKLKQSKEYLAVAKKMGGMLKHFEQASWKSAWGDCASSGKP